MVRVQQENTPMKITLEIPSDRIANLMISAIESGDPVTTASRGGWCWGIYCGTIDADPPAGIWYAESAFWEKNFQIQIVEVEDENIYDRGLDMAGNIKSGCLKVHTIRRTHFKAGLEAMAAKFPHAFAQIMTDDTDAPCADAFLQSIVFGEEKYA